MITYLLFVIRGMIPLCDVGIAVGETLVVSAENKPLIAIATGTLTTITETTVTMVVDRSVMMFSEFFCILLTFSAYGNLNYARIFVKVRKI